MQREVFLKESNRASFTSGVTVWGRYRLIDFMLSNMVNSNIHSVAVLQVIKPFTNGSRWFRQTVGFR